MQRIHNVPADRKRRLVRIDKSLVYKDVELYTYKYRDAQPLPSVQQSDAVAADVAEYLDGAIVSRALAFRDAELRRLLTAYMADDERYCADDTVGLDKVLVYPLLLSPEFRDGNLEPLAEYMHRYLVWGVLYDWYADMGLPQASRYEQDLKRVEDDMMDALRTPSRVNKPLQPFGPAEKIR